MRWRSFLLIALLGLGLRLKSLGARPMHTDEAVNAYIVGQSLAGKPVRYDPVDRHGPALTALALPLVRAQGAHTFGELTEAELRVTSVLAGTMTLMLFGAAVELFGLAPCLIAAGWTATASLPVYYDRYFIHESLFVAASFAFILTAWKAWRRQSTKQAIFAGAAAGMMLACKETAVLHLVALGAAVFVCRLWKRSGCSSSGMPHRADLLTAGGTCLLVSVGFYTRMGHDWHALSTLQQVVSAVMARASGQGHQQPIWYYAHLLSTGWSGGIFCILATTGFILAIRERSSSPRCLLAVYAIIIAMLYSLIPYKTPWLALNLWVPLALLAGFAAHTAYRKAISVQPIRLVLPITCLAACVIGIAVAHDTFQRVFLHPADENNPYAYAHTSEDLLNLPSALQRSAHEQGITSPRIAVIAADPWPLPWYLRTYSQTGFWQPGQDVGTADFYITSTEAAEQYKAQLRDMHLEFFGVRPGVLILLWSRDRN
jgi:uncharacterized protein (TIGR03663 family)